MLSRLKNVPEKFLKQFDGRSPFWPQVIIGVGCVIFRPLSILMNKKEDPEKKIPASSRIFATEVIALPIALGVAAGAGKVGKLFSKNNANSDSIKAYSETAGFVVANLIIPSIATNVLHKFPIKEKMQEFALNHSNRKKTEAPATFSNFNNPNVKNIQKPQVRSPQNQQFRTFMNKSPYSGTLRI